MPAKLSPKTTDPVADQEAAANYIAAMTRDLSRIAQQHGMTTLGYLLDIARLEAERSVS